MLKIFKTSKIHKMYICIVSFIASVLGLLSSVTYLKKNILMFNDYYYYLMADEVNEVIFIAIISLIFSLFGLIGTLLVYKNIQLAGVFMFVSAIGGMFTIGVAFALSAILFMPMGIICLALSKSKLVQIY